ncbi:signal recognition particle subunit SRP68 [Biomphalaria glabrata]|uniref:Signal recognition particle subunit SRP68 n=1 Tax=Biomphalaria glabrata TaxID=6526 RepID=A0A2C9JFV8_BIOGL|nr:signal recognition particle subunit SRP68-like [Biomphalaria glabrata]KAI8765183.1 signal recognition particle subunit SRP68-like [Biomphalaria glabrata]KAI8797162.1 signal recognition particle subunit SRP68 [Biomphalaria glabrata]
MAAEGENVTGDSANSSTPPNNETSKAISYTLEALQLIKDAQQQHGLRHGDYQRYRGYCSRRIKRIRKSLHFPQGNRNRVTPKKIKEEILTDTRYLHLPLFCAERCWAYAMQLKSEANTEPRKRFHMISKLKKAVVYAEELESIGNSVKCDARTKLECQAYSAWIKGCLEFEEGKWESAMEYYTKAKTIYEKLANAFSEEVQAVYQQRVDEIAPNLRYCAYNIGDESALQDLQKMRIAAGGDQLSFKLDDLLSQTREKQAATLSEVTWRGRTVPVKVEAVRLFLLNMQDLNTELAAAESLDSRVSIYESILKQCIDAQQALRDTLQEDQVFKAAVRGQPIEGKISNQHYLHSYLMYIRLTTTVDRNLLMIENLKQNLPENNREEGRKITKPQDLVRLYDIIIQNLNDIPNLHGIQEDATIVSEIETSVLGYKAFRSYYIARSYASAKKWKETVSLYQRALDNCKKAIGGLKKQTQNGKIKQEISALEELEQHISGQMFSCQAYSILDSSSTGEQTFSTQVTDKRPLEDRLDEYLLEKSLTSKKATLTRFPPEFEPIPCRPLFFDLALNHIEFPSLEDKLEQKKAAGGGLTGMVKGWLFGGGKK